MREPMCDGRSDRMLTVSNMSSSSSPATSLDEPFADVDPSPRDDVDDCRQRMHAERANMVQENVIILETISRSKRSL